MKTKLIAVMLVAGGSAFAQGQFGGDVNGGGPGYDGGQGVPPAYNGAPGEPGYGGGPGYGGAPGYGAPAYNDAQAYGGAPGYYPSAPAGAYVPPPLCAPGNVLIDGYNGVNGYCAVPPYSGAYWIGPGYYGGRFIAGYWGGPRGFVGGYGFRGGAGFVGHNDFRGGGVGGRAFAGNNFRGGAVVGQSFAGNNSFRGGARRTILQRRVELPRRSAERAIFRRWLTRRRRTELGWRTLRRRSPIDSWTRSEHCPITGEDMPGNGTGVAASALKPWPGHMCSSRSRIRRTTG